jgi:hypothetical protein
MEGPSPRNSVLGSATVIAAVISGMTALVTALMPWLLGKPDPATQQPLPIQVFADASGASPVHQAAPIKKTNLTLGVWTIVASIDEEGSDFTGSTLKFLTQQETPSGLEATGFFEWRIGEELIGREQVIANYDAAARRLYIQGKEVDQPDRLAVGSFSAELSEDGQRLINGAWGNTPGYRVGVLGTWEARR